MGGVEPPRPFGHTDLNRARLPFRHIPVAASPRACRFVTSCDRLLCRTSPDELISPSTPERLARRRRGSYEGQKCRLHLRGDARAAAGYHHVLGSRGGAGERAAAL